MSTRGLSAICAFFTAVMVFVKPGPAVTAATPGTPESLATASAANTAVTLALTGTGMRCVGGRGKRERAVGVDKRFDVDRGAVVLPRVACQ
jgi:hypothetical protein